MSISPSVLRGVAALAVGVTAGYQLFASSTSRKTLLRPPGALDEAGFAARCIRCGKCALSCPYRVINFDAIASGATPFITPREGACEICEDFPCIAACPSGALAPVANRRSVKMGTAVIDRANCIALQGTRCEVCYRSCPFIDEAIKLEVYVNKNAKNRAIFEPVIDSNHCVGCGICVKRCVISNPVVPIYIKPRDS